MAPSDARPVVYLTSGIFGYLYRFFPIGRQLVERGHRVVIVTASSEAVDHAGAAGFDTRHLSHQEAAIAALPVSSWSGLLRPLARRLPGASLGPRSAARRHWRRRTEVLGDTSELERTLGELDPCLVLTEAEEHRDILACLAMGIDLLLFEDLYSTRPGIDVPFPAKSHLVPTGSRRSRLRAAASWRSFFAVEAVRRRAERWWVDGDDWHSMLEVIAGRTRLESDQVSRRYFQYYDYLTVPRLRTTAPELAFPGEPQPPIIVGPIIDVARTVHETDERFEERWAESLQRRRDGARIVYVSLGTFLTGMELLTEDIIEAALAIPDIEVVVSVGRDHVHWRDVDLPTNVAVFGRVPQMRVLVDVDVVVSTGGLNTGQEALYFGVPVLNIPGPGLDVAGNSARLAYHGVGRQLTPRNVDVATIRRELRLLLDDQEYRRRATSVGESLRRWNGADRAAKAIERHLQRG